MPTNTPEPGLKDVAAHAGVSIATVSRVINNAPYIRDAMRERVLNSMQALGYEPHALAQSLRTGQTQTIGYVIYDISNALFSIIALGIDDRLQQYGYTMLLTNSRGDPQHEAALIKLMLRRRVDGLIVALSDESHAETHNTLSQLRVPLVLLDREVADARADLVVTDHESGVTQALDHLYELGHRRIALITGPSTIRPGRVTYAAFVATMLQLGLPIAAEFMRVGVQTEDDVFQALDALLALPHPPTALIAGSIQATLGTLRYVRDRNVRVPEQLSVVCYEDTDAAQLMQPQFTVIARDIYQIGQQAAHVLLDRIEHPDAEQHIAVIPMRLIVRGSTAAPHTPLPK